MLAFGVPATQNMIINTRKLDFYHFDGGNVLEPPFELTEAYSIHPQKVYRPVLLYPKTRCDPKPPPSAQQQDAAERQRRLAARAPSAAVADCSPRIANGNHPEPRFWTLWCVLLDSCVLVLDGESYFYMSRDGHIPTTTTLLFRTQCI